MSLTSRSLYLREKSPPSLYLWGKSPPSLYLREKSPPVTLPPGKEPPVALPLGKELPVAIESGAGGVSLDGPARMRSWDRPARNLVIMLNMISRLHLHLLPRVRMSMSGSVAVLSHISSWCAHGNLYLPDILWSMKPLVRSSNLPLISQSLDQTGPPAIH